MSLTGVPHPRIPHSPSSRQRTDMISSSLTATRIRQSSWRQYVASSSRMWIYIIDPIVSTGWDTVLTECEEAGIPVIVIDRTIDDSDKYISWQAPNRQEWCIAAGEWLALDAKASKRRERVVIEGITIFPHRSDVRTASRRSQMQTAGICLISDR